MENQFTEDEIEIDLLEVFHVLRRKIAIIIACFLVGALIAGAGTKLLITPLYSSSSMIYILTKTTSVTSLADIQMGTALTVDFQTVATSRTVIEQVIEDLNLNTTYEELIGTITVVNPTDTHILRTTVKNADPKLAAEISNAMSNVIAEQVAAIMNTDKPTIVEKAIVSKNPSSPNTKRNVLIGALLGAMLAIGIILLRYFLDDTLQNEEDVQKYLRINTLAAIPILKEQSRQTKSKKRKKK